MNIYSIKNLFEEGIVTYEACGVSIHDGDFYANRSSTGLSDYVFEKIGTECFTLLEEARKAAIARVDAQIDADRAAYDNLVVLKRGLTGTKK